MLLARFDFFFCIILYSLLRFFSKDEFDQIHLIKFFNRFKVTEASKKGWTTIAGASGYVSPTSENYNPNDGYQNSNHEGSHEDWNTGSS